MPSIRPYRPHPGAPQQRHRGAAARLCLHPCGGHSSPRPAAVRQLRVGLAQIPSNSVFFLSQFFFKFFLTQFFYESVFFLILINSFFLQVSF